MADKRFTTDTNEFEWDENKNQSNQQKHNISFEEATEAFDDQNSVILIGNVTEENNSNRWLRISKIINAFISVVYTMRKSVIRIISARPASKKERKEYINQTNNE